MLNPDNELIHLYGFLKLDVVSERIERSALLEERSRRVGILHNKESIAGRKRHLNVFDGQVDSAVHY